MLKDYEDGDVYAIVSTELDVSEVESIIGYVRSQYDDWCVDDIIRNIMENDKNAMSYDLRDVSVIKI